MAEWCLVSDEGVIEDGFYTREAAEDALAKADPDDELQVDERENYDDDGNWIEEADGDEDE